MLDSSSARNHHHHHHHHQEEARKENKCHAAAAGHSVRPHRTERIPSLFIADLATLQGQETSFHNKPRVGSFVSAGVLNQSRNKTQL